MNAKEIRIIIGIIGNVLSFFITLSYIPKVIEIYKKKSVENFEQHRHVAMLVNCSLWIFYGLPIVQNDCILVTTSNGVGFVIEAIYVIVFIIYCDKKSIRMLRTWTCLMLEFGFVYLFYSFTIRYIKSLSIRRTFIGVVCSIYTIIMHGSISWDKMLDANSYRFMPFWFSLVNFVNAGIWIAYSLIYKIDIYILIIYVLGTLVCASQLIIGCFPNDSPFSINNRVFPN